MSGYLQGLPPDLLAQLAKLGANGTLDYGGMSYSPIGLSSLEDGSFTPQGYLGVAQGAPLNQVGTKGVEYGLDGSGYIPWENSGSAFKPSDFQDLGQAALTVLAGYTAGAGLAAAGAGSAAGIGGSGLAAGAGDTALVGEGAEGLGGAGTDIFGGNGMSTGFTDTGTAGGALDTGYAGSGALTGATGLVSPTGLGNPTSSIADWLTKSGLSPSLGGLLAPALGALAGSQPQKTTEQKDIPEWLKPYVLGSSGQTGLLGYANQLLQKQMSPGYLAGYDQMRSVGQGLLGAPIAGNGFTKFFGDSMPATAPTGGPQAVAARFAQGRR